MKHPIWLALGAGAAVLVLALAMPLWHMWRGAPVAPESPAAVGTAGNPHAAMAPGSVPGLPWQVQVQPDGGSTVLGLRLGRDTLADVQALFGDSLQLGLVARIDETGGLEGLVDPMRAGFVSGRLVASFEVPVEALQRWRQRSTDHAPMSGGTRRFKLKPDDLAEAQRAPLASLSFVPGVRLGEADVRERFGPPAETRALPDNTTALLYPAQGLLVLVQPGSRGVLQYVAPAQFDQRLRAPLLAMR